MASSSSLVVGCLAAIMLSACTSSSPPATTAPTSTAATSSVTPTSAAPSPTPTSTWSTEQLAAIQAVEDYRSAIGKIEADPSGFTEAEMRAALRKVAGGDVIPAKVNTYVALKKQGYRYDGKTLVVSTKASRPSNASYGREVVVTSCLDQRGLRVLDKTGSEVSEAELGYAIPDFNLRQYTVVKTKGAERFLVYGLSPGKGECGS